MESTVAMLHMAETVIHLQHACSHINESVTHLVKAGADVARASDPVMICGVSQIASGVSNGVQSAEALALAASNHSHEIILASIPDSLNVGIVGVCTFFRICVKIYDARHVKNFPVYVAEIITKNVGIACMQMLASSTTKVIIAGVLELLPIGLSHVVSCVIGGLSAGYLGYELGELVGHGLAHFIPNPNYENRSHWIERGKWMGCIFGVGFGIVLCITCPLAAIVLGGAALSIFASKIMIENLDA